MVKIKKTCHEILSQATYDMERFQFNTVVSATMKLLNTIDLFLQHQMVIKNHLKKIVNSGRIFFDIVAGLYPIAPHICYYIWNNVQYENVWCAS